MGISENIYTRLSGYAGLTALVGSRIYPVIVPQTASYPGSPRVTYEMMGAMRESAFGSDTGIVRSRYQVSCFATTQAEAKAVAVQVRGALKRWRDDTTYNVLDCFMENEFDDYEYDLNTYISTLDFEVIHRE